MEKLPGKLFMGDDLHTTGHIFFGDKDLHAAHMICVAMGENHRLDGFVGYFAEGLMGAFRIFHRRQAVHQDKPVFAFNKRAIGGRIGEGRVNIPLQGLDIFDHGACVLGQVGMDAGWAHAF